MQAAFLLLQIVGRLRLDGELVKRQMLGAQRQGFRQFGAPGRFGLAGPRLDEIEGNALENALRQCQRRQRLRPVMQAAQLFQVGVIQRLHAQ